MPRDGISELMTAETKASKIVTEARAARGERMKEAKREADAVVAQLAQQKAAQFQGASAPPGADVFASDALSTEAEISKMRSAFAAGRKGAAGMLVSVATGVSLDLAETAKLSWQRRSGRQA